MNTQTQEALKMAKIFIENSDYKIINLGKGVHVTKDGVIKAIDIALATNKDSSLVQLTIKESLKMAGYDLDGVIADVEKFDGFDDVCLQTIKLVRNVIAEALEQPAQHNFCSRCGKRASKDPNHIHTCTPPHQWQGLTDDERIKCYETSGHKQHIRPQDKFAVLELSIAIEQALKEKNHG
jgi:hypothetical protein